MNIVDKIKKAHPELTPKQVKFIAKKVNQRLRSGKGCGGAFFSNLVDKVKSGVKSLASSAKEGVKKLAGVVVEKGLDKLAEVTNKECKNPNPAFDVKLKSGEKHQVFLKDGCSYRGRFSGPGTHVIEDVKDILSKYGNSISNAFQEKNFVSPVDMEAAAHDCRYMLSDGSKDKIREADQKFIAVLSKMSDPNRLVPLAAMKAKVLAEDYKLTEVYGSEREKMSDADRKLLEDVLKHLERKGFGITGGARFVPIPLPAIYNVSDEQKQQALNSVRDEYNQQTYEHVVLNAPVSRAEMAEADYLQQYLQFASANNIPPDSVENYIYRHFPIKAFRRRMNAGRPVEGGGMMVGISRYGPSQPTVFRTGPVGYPHKMPDFPTHNAGYPPNYFKLGFYGNPELGHNPEPRPNRPPRTHSYNVPIKMTNRVGNGQDDLYDFPTLQQQAGLPNYMGYYEGDQFTNLDTEGAYLPSGVPIKDSYDYLPTGSVPYSVKIGDVSARKSYTGKGKDKCGGADQVTKEDLVLTGAGKKKGKKRSAGGNTNPWIKAVKDVQKRDGVSYKEAMVIAGKEYKK